MKTANMWFVGRWISVSDQLPEPETVVLACFDNGEVSSVWQDWKNSDDPFTYIGFPNEDAQTVTHWMPLPDPVVKNTSAFPKKFGSTLLLVAPNFSQMRSGMEEIEKLIARCAQTANLDPNSVFTKISAGELPDQIVIGWSGKERRETDG